MSYDAVLIIPPFTKAWWVPQVVDWPCQAGTPDLGNVVIDPFETNSPRYVLGGINDTSMPMSHEMVTIVSATPSCSTSELASATSVFQVGTACSPPQRTQTQI